MTTIKEQLQKEELIVKDINGISMYPLFVEGEDLVQIENIKDDIKLYDIVLFLRGNDDNKYILHRVIEVKKKYCVVCGDNQNEKEIVFNNQIIGRVTGYYKKGRYVSIKDEEYKDYLSKLELDLSKRKLLKPLNKNQRDFLSLLKVSMNICEVEQKDFNFEEIYKIASFQHLVPFVFNAIKKECCDKQIYEKFKAGFYQNLERNILINKEKETVLKKFKEKKIRYMVLKGEQIEKLYPIYGSRFYTDIDVLIDRASSASSIMSSFGYKIKESKDFVLECKKKPNYCFEIHEKLFVIKDKVENYFNNYLDKANKKDDFEYTMNNEDFIVYNLGHFKKHHRYGTGIRFYIDFYFLINKLTIDKNKMESILKQLDLYDFYLYVLKTIDYLFNNNDEVIYDDNNIFSNYLFGDMNTIISKEIKQYGKFKYFLRKVFPPISIAYQYMPIVYEHPILYPIAWVYRLFIKLTSSKELKKIKMEIKQLLN